MEKRQRPIPSPAERAARAPDAPLLERLGEAERRLVELESLLGERSRLEEMGELAGGLAHELANLMAPMVLAARALSEDVGSGGGADGGRLVAGLDACSGVIAAVLRLTQGLPPRLSGFGARELVGVAVAQAAALDRRGELSLRWDAGGVRGFGCVASLRAGITSALICQARRSEGLGGVSLGGRCSTWNIVGQEAIEWGAWPSGAGDGETVVVEVSGRGDDPPGAWVFDGWSGGARGSGSIGLAMAARLLRSGGGAIGVRGSGGKGEGAIVVAFSVAPV